MIERIETGERSSKIVKYNGVAHLTGQVADGDTIQEQVRSGHAPTRACGEAKLARTDLKVEFIEDAACS